MKLVAGLCMAVATMAAASTSLHAPVVSLDPDLIGKPAVANWTTFNGDYSDLANPG